MAVDLEPITLSPPPEPPASSPPRPARPWPRWVVLSLLLAVIALVAGDVAVLLTREGEPSPDELLADARSFANARTSASFEGDVRIDVKGPDGSDFSERVEIKGVTRLPDRARYTVSSQDVVSEIIVIGDRLYIRSAERTELLAGRKWDATEPDAQDDRDGVVRPRNVAASADVIGDPVVLLRAVGAARRPVVLRRDEDVTVLRADVKAAEAFGTPIAGGLNAATIELTIRGGDRLERVVLAVRGEGGRVRTDYRFSTWGRTVVLAAPAESERDPTPGIDEEAVAAFKDVEQLLQPRGIPAGWVLDAALILPEDMTVEGCEQLELDYIEPNDPDEGFLTLYELPKSCADLEVPRGAQPYKAGRYSGFADESRDGVTAQIVVGNTVVQAETDLPLDALTRILADLVPLDLGSPPAELPAFGPTTAA